MAPSAEGSSGVPAAATISGLTASLRLPVLAALYANPEVTARGPAADAPTRCGSPGGALKDGHRGVDAEGHHQAGHRPGEPFVGAGHAVLDGQGAALEREQEPEYHRQQHRVHDLDVDGEVDQVGGSRGAAPNLVNLS